MTRFRQFVLVLSWCCAASLVAAQGSSVLSADVADPKTLAIQQKVEELFQAGEFKRALFIYRNELVPLGDKYAQYMVGFMYEMGMGADRDLAKAAAWYRLAAERGMPEFIVVREKAESFLGDDERRRAAVEYAAIYRAYSDLAVLMALVERDMAILRQKTGSRLGSESSSLTVINPRTGSTRSGAEYFGNLRRQVEQRLQLIIDLGDFQGLEADMERINLRELERLVAAKIEEAP